MLANFGIGPLAQESGASRNYVLASVSAVKCRLVGACFARYFACEQARRAHMRASPTAAKENNHDVDRDRRRHAAPCASVLHHARDRGQEERRACAGGRGRYRQPAAGVETGPLDHLLQRPRRAVLPQRGAAVHRACRRRGHRRLCRPEIPLEDPERDRLRDRSPALPAEFRPRLHQDGEDRLCDRNSADASRPYRSGAADLRECLSAAAAHHGTLLCLRPGGGAHGDRARPQDRGALERRHVALSRHRPLFQSGARLGQARAREARGAES